MKLYETDNWQIWIVRKILEHFKAILLNVRRTKNDFFTLFQIYSGCLQCLKM